MKASRAASLPLGGAHVPLHLKRFLTSSDGLVELVWLFWKNLRSQALFNGIGVVSICFIVKGLNTDSLQNIAILFT